jgi:hypothetical protein
MRTLEQMKETAQRQLDGMIVNRDVMAQDVLTLVNSIESFRQKAATPQSTSFATAFQDIFSDIFGFKPGDPK